MQPNLDLFELKGHTSSQLKLNRFSLIILFAYSLKPPTKYILFLSLRNEVMLDMNEWQSDYFDSTPEMSWWICWASSLQLRSGLSTLSLGEGVTLLRTIQAWFWFEGWMSFLLLTFFLFWFAKFVGVDCGEIGILRTALIAVDGYDFFIWLVIEL